MEGNSNRVWLWCVVTIWLCFGSTLVVWSLTRLEDNHITLPTAIDYPVLPFPITNINYQSYHDFMEILRNQVADTNNIRDDGVRVLRNRNTLTLEERFLLVQLTVEEREGVINSVTLALNVSNLYLVGFRVENRAYFFRRSPRVVTDNLFIDASNRPNDMYLSFTENYISLEDTGGARSSIDLGSNQLRGAVRSLYLDSAKGVTISQPRRTARSLIICIEMISEAARNYLIEGRISTRIFNSEISPPDPEMISYMGYWGKISNAFQLSNQGAFNNPIQLRNRFDQVITVSNINDYCVRATMAVIQYACKEEEEQNQLSPLIRSVVATDDDAVCEVPEPTVRIVGPNNLCADVKNGDYNNGNAIMLWPCKSNKDVNQFWTLKNDGTIQSNGKCLTADGSTPNKSEPGDYIMIYDCPSELTDRTHWKVWNNGTITSRTGLVLAAKSWNSGTELTVETNVYTTGQSWRPTNNTEPSVASIIGLKSLCLQATGNNVWLEKCASDKAEQAWALYADGSIRPQQNRDSCLSNRAESGIIVEILPCDPQSTGQRWEFQNGGIIMNLYDQSVLDVACSDPRIKRIVVEPFSGNANQKWLPVF